MPNAAFSFDGQVGQYVVIDSEETSFPLTLVDENGVDIGRWTIIGNDGLGVSDDATITITGDKTATFTRPSGEDGQAYLLECVVNNGRDSADTAVPAYRYRMVVSFPSDEGFDLLASGETMERNAFSGWIAVINRLLKFAEMINDSDATYRNRLSVDGYRETLDVPNAGTAVHGYSPAAADALRILRILWVISVKTGTGTYIYDYRSITQGNGVGTATLRGQQASFEAGDQTGTPPSVAIVASVLAVETTIAGVIYPAGTTLLTLTNSSGGSFSKVRIGSATMLEIPL